MKNTNRCTIICGILSLVLLVANFLPFWFYDGTSASIQGYIWLPEHYDALEKFISEQMGTQFMLNNRKRPDDTSGRLRLSKYYKTSLCD